MTEQASVSSDSLAHYPHIPEFYFVARGLAGDALEATRNALVITPIAYAIVTDVSDQKYAKQFAPTVLLAQDEENAKGTAQAIYDMAESSQWARSVIIRAQDNPLTSVYSNREAITVC